MKSSSQTVRLHYTFFSCFWFSAVLQQRLANAHLHCPWVHVFVVLVELCGADVSRSLQDVVRWHPFSFPPLLVPNMPYEAGFERHGTLRWMRPPSFDAWQEFSM